MDTMLQCAIYARHSIDAQNPRSSDDQVRECEQYAVRQGWVIVPDHVYKDEAVSGANINGIEYTQLKQAAQQGAFECILLDDLSRHGRDMVESATIYRDLSAIGVRIVSVADGIDTSTASSKMPFYFKGMMNELFLDDLRLKVVRGLKSQIIMGYSTGGCMYGYTTEAVLDPNGSEDRFGRPVRFGCKIIVNELEAAVVRRIFKLKTQGLGVRSIADQLNRDGVPSPRSGSP